MPNGVEVGVQHSGRGMIGGSRTRYDNNVPLERLKQAISQGNGGWGIECGRGVYPVFIFVNVPGI